MPEDMPEGQYFPENEGWYFHGMGIGDERYGVEIKFEWDVKPILATDVIRFLTSLDLVVRESVYDVLDAMNIGAEISLREESRKGRVHELRITRLETGSIKGVVLGLLKDAWRKKVILRGHTLDVFKGTLAGCFAFVFNTYVLSPLLLPHTESRGLRSGEQVAPSDTKPYPNANIAATNFVLQDFSGTVTLTIGDQTIVITKKKIAPLGEEPLNPSEQ